MRGRGPGQQPRDQAPAVNAYGLITWIEGDAAAIPVATQADLVVMTGNAAQAVLQDDEWAATLQHTREALRPGGVFAFETTRPERRAWDDWAADTQPRTEIVPAIGPVEERMNVTDVDLPFVSFRYTYRFLDDNTELTSDSTLRFRDRAEVSASLRAAGFTVEDIRDAPDRPGRKFVFLARRR